MAYSFGSYTFPSGWVLATDDRSAELSTAKKARDHGDSGIPRYRRGKKITLRGKFARGQLGVANTATGVRDAIDDLAAALNETPQTTLVLDNGRYHRKVQGGSLIHSYQDATHNRLALVSADFVAQDPFQYEVTSRGYTYTNGDAIPWTVNNSYGSTKAAPLIRVNLAAIAVLKVKITNSTTGEYFTLSGLPADTSIYVDCLNRCVTYGNFLELDLLADKAAFALFDQMFPSLAVGANSWRIDALAGNVATVDSIVYSWNGRLH